MTETYNYEKRKSLLRITLNLRITVKIIHVITFCYIRELGADNLVSIIDKDTKNTQMPFVGGCTRSKLRYKQMRSSNVLGSDALNVLYLSRSLFPQIHSDTDIGKCPLQCFCRFRHSGMVSCRTDTLNDEEVMKKL